MRAAREFEEVYLYTGVLDMRLGVDRLSGLVQEWFKRSVLTGGLFVFVSRCRRKVKLLYWDRDGYALWVKRLEAGVFRIENKDGSEQLTGVELEELLMGMELSRIKLRKSAASGLYGE
jgi:transposase